MNENDTGSSWFADFEAALRSAKPTESLRDTVARLLDSGNDREVIQQSLEQFRLVLREADREAAEDVVLEVLDFLTGWCSPHQRLD